MTDFKNTMSIAASGMAAQATRLRVSSENIANTDTPGFRRKTLAFEQHLVGSEKAIGVRAGEIVLDKSQLSRIYNPGHPMANEQGYYSGSNVNMVVEIADSREAQRSYEANLKMFDQARKMASSMLELLRR